MRFANCNIRHILRLFRLFRGDRSGIEKSSSTTCLLYSDVVKGDPSPTWLRRNQEEDEEGAVKRGVREFRFIIILQLFSSFFFSFYFSIILLYHFFYTFFLPTTFTHTNALSTHTHDPYPLPTTHDL